ncbi:MAG TPA: hypothetical protein VKY59_16510, partial [Spirillospora sp.]|nr:hypothetical protein [Spirillospora sp.]
ALIAGPERSQRPNQNDVLAEWNTTTVQNGQYTLQLSMHSTRGGVVRRSVNVQVLNPTPTPQPTATSTPPPPPPVATATTLPFPTPFSQGVEAPNGPVTPTATLVIGG